MGALIIDTIMMMIKLDKKRIIKTRYCSSESSEPVTMQLELKSNFFQDEEGNISDPEDAKVLNSYIEKLLILVKKLLNTF
jgi:hypothetical protein